MRGAGMAKRTLAKSRYIKQSPNMHPSRSTLIVILLLALSSTVLPACGKKGPLYLPDQQQAGK